MSEYNLLSALSDTEKKVEGILLENPEMTQDDMAGIMGMSKSGIILVAICRPI